MSKKRVNEIAKELKDQGVELDNKEVVTELLSLGYEVKSPSSSLEDDQANAAIQKILDKKKPRAAPAPVAAKGFVVRRKTAHGDGEAPNVIGITSGPDAVAWPTDDVFHVAMCGPAATTVMVNHSLSLLTTLRAGTRR